MRVLSMPWRANSAFAASIISARVRSRRRECRVALGSECVGCVMIDDLINLAGQTVLERSAPARPPIASEKAARQQTPAQQRQRDRNEDSDQPERGLGVDLIGHPPEVH